jgi:hypothetical protein
MRYNWICSVLLVLFEIKEIKFPLDVSNSLTDGPTFKLIQTDYVQRM